MQILLRPCKPDGRTAARPAARILALPAKVEWAQREQ